MDLEINDFNYRIEKDIGEFFEELDLSNKAKNLFYRLPDYKIHSLKVTKIAEKVAKELEYSPEKVKSIKKSALMHDIGKLKVNPDIFLNDKKLTQKQRKIYIEPHIKKTKEILEELDEFTEKEIKIATQHHETINGKGYPEGLGGDEISQEGKILKACDTFEAITDDRLHNPAKTLDKTKEIMEDLSGKKIDRKIANITYEKGVEVYKDYLKKVIPHTTLKKFKNHRNFEEAKNGNYDKAREMVEELVNDKNIELLEEMTPKRSILLPVVSQEEKNNKIPKAYADYISEKTGYAVDTDIKKLKKENRKNKTAMERLLNRNNFQGNIKENVNYILVDDVVTQGGTLRDLEEYIENNGGNVEKHTTISYSQYSTMLEPSIKLKNKIENNIGKEKINNYLKKYNIAEKLDDLTGGEARYIAKFKNFKNLKRKTIKTLENLEKEKNIIKEQKGEYMTNDYNDQKSIKELIEEENIEKIKKIIEEAESEQEIKMINEKILEKNSELLFKETKNKKLFEIINKNQKKLKEKTKPRRLTKKQRNKWINMYRENKEKFKKELNKLETKENTKYNKILSISLTKNKTIKDDLIKDIIKGKEKSMGNKKISDRDLMI